MIVRTNFLLHTLALALLLLSIANTNDARPYKADSPIKTIIVPYQRTALSPLTQMRQVQVPLQMEMVPHFHLAQGSMALGSQKGMPLNFADGAYPVYYMPGNANGHFNGKISLLT